MHRKLVEPPGWQIVETPETCPLCERPIPPAQRDAHHLVPRMKGGKVTVPMHRICHRHVHALFTETELARTYSTPQALLANAEVRKFVEWVRTKPDDFYERTRRPAKRR